MVMYMIKKNVNCNFKKFCLVILLLLITFMTACTALKPIKESTNVATDNQYEPYDNIETADLLDNQKNNKLSVGILLPLTGKAEKIGKIMLKSAQLSMFNNKLNNIALLPYDTKGTAFGAVEAINSAIRDNVDIIVGPLFTQSTKAIMDIAEMNNIIMLSFSDNQNLLDSKHPNVYLMGLTPQQEIYRMVSYLIDYQNFYGFSAMFPNDVYGSIANNSFKDVIFRKDAKIVKTEFYTKNDKNLQKKVNNILNANTFKDEVYEKYEQEKALAKAEGLSLDVEFKYTDEDKIYADALLLPDSGEELLKIGEDIANSTSEHKPLMVGTSKWLNNNLYTNPNFKNALFVAPNPNNYVSFENMYYNVYQEYPLRVASLAYDAITAVIQSYAKAKNKDNLKYAIENYQGFDGVNGKFRFLSNGLLERRLAIIKIKNGMFEIIDYDDEPFLKY